MANVSEVDFYIAVGVLGGACFVLLCGFIGLTIWIAILQKRVKKINYLADFKIQRPQLNKPKENDYNFSPSPNPMMPKTDYDYDNQGYRPSERPSTFKPALGGSSSMNPIASRTQQPQQPPAFASANSNFSYGPGPSQFNNKMPNENSRFGGGY